MGWVPSAINAIKFNKEMSDLATKRGAADTDKIKVSFREFIRTFLKFGDVKNAKMDASQRMLGLLDSMDRSGMLLLFSLPVTLFTATTATATATTVTIFLLGYSSMITPLCYESIPSPQYIHYLISLSMYVILLSHLCSMLLSKCSVSSPIFICRYVTTYSGG